MFSVTSGRHGEAQAEPVGNASCPGAAPPNVDVAAALVKVRGILDAGVVAWHSAEEAVDVSATQPVKQQPPKEIEPYYRSDHMINRFLMAAKWDADVAGCMLVDHLKWLAEHRVLELLEEVPFPEEQVIRQCYPQAYHGTDKQGRPLFIDRAGLLDIGKLNETVGIGRLLDYLRTSLELQMRRRLPACSLAKGELVDRSLTIVDLHGLSFRTISSSQVRTFVMELVSLGTKHYPELAGEMLLINTPRCFSVMWTFVSGFLSESEKERTHIYGSDVKEWQAHLLRLVDADQLPALYGGSHVCDGVDPLSCLASEVGPWLRPDIMRIIDANPLEKIMTPGGVAELAPQNLAAWDAAGLTYSFLLPETALVRDGSPVPAGEEATFGCSMCNQRFALFCILEVHERFAHACMTEPVLECTADATVPPSELQDIAPDRAACVSEVFDEYGDHVSVNEDDPCGEHVPRGTLIDHDESSQENVSLPEMALVDVMKVASSVHASITCAWDGLKVGAAESTEAWAKLWREAADELEGDDEESARPQVVAHFSDGTMILQ